MTKKIVWALILLCTFVTNYAYAAPPQKKLAAQRVTSAIKTDGNLDEDAWKTAPLATDFIESRPAFGALEKADSKTEIFILYDNTSIYIGGYCHEKTADSVSRELAGRDKIGSNDFLGVIFDTYNDKINASGFYVTPLGEQYDAKYSNTGGEDDTWNAVWYSEAKIVKDGWTFEMRIPYSALRFSSKGTEWGINIIRRRQKTGQQFSWNPVDPTVSGFVNQEGLWTGITNIKSPLRLSFSPYFSAYINHYPYKTEGVKDLTKSINGGMDVKYGISQSLTLDMTLIPDFGQVQSDKQVLNLTPFEVKYSENRPFFTEGTELFNKGNLFYSRRVGGEPIHKYDIYGSLDSTETIVDNPNESKLINATKISGRNQKGLGIGFFNAVTKPMYAEVENTITHKKRDLKTGSLTNYNIIVIDQTLKNNSSVSLINTSVLRSGVDYDANVTAAVFDMNNKKNTYNLNGKIAVSNLSFDKKNISGYSHTLGFGKTGGRFGFNLTEELANEKYDINDMGLLFNNNYMDHYLWIGYKWVKPGKVFNNLYLNWNNNLSHRFKDGAFQSYNVNTNLNGQLKSLWYVGAALYYNAPGHDFYEPRLPGKVFNTGSSAGWEGWFNSNGAKKYFIVFDASTTYKKLFKGTSYYLYFSHRYRFNDKFSLNQDITLSPAKNSAGFADIDPAGNIIFSRRNRTTVENTVGVKYNFSKNSGLTLNARHYWSEVKAKQFYVLTADGNLSDNTSYNGNVDYNVNIFNVDMVYTWQFSAGSFMYVVWKNNILDFENERGYFKNLTHTLSSPQNNNLSVKVIYYLDYLKLRKKV